MRIKLIVNPKAGMGRCGKLFPLVQKRLVQRGLIDPQPFFTQYKGDGRRLVQRAEKEGYERIIACGGDGTINEVINGIIGKDMALGIMPLGTGNDYARSLGIKEDIDFASNLLLDGKVREVDLIRVNGGRYYGGIGAVGFDSEVALLAERYKRFVPSYAIYLPLFPYVFAVLVKLISFRFKKVWIRYDGGEYKGKILLAALGNTKFYGRGMLINPRAVFDDGWMDICLIKRVNKLKLLYLFPQVFKGNHIKAREVEVYRTKRISIESENPLTLLGDGEIISKTPLLLEIVPKAIKVILPP